MEAGWERREGHVRVDGVVQLATPAAASAVPLFTSGRASEQTCATRSAHVL